MRYRMLKTNWSISLLVILLLSGYLLPLASSQTASKDIQRPDTLVYSEIEDVQNEIEDVRNNPSPLLLNSTKFRMESELAPEDYEKPDTTWKNFEVENVTPNNPEIRMTPLYSDIENYSDLYGKDSFFEYLLDRETSSYYIYTRYLNNSIFTRDYLRPMAIPPDLETGKGVDIDNDVSTGNSLGEDIFISLSPTLIVEKLPSLIPFNRSMEFKVGLELNFQRYRTIEENLVFHVIKYISYQERNYLFDLGVTMERTPTTAKFAIYSEKVVMELAPAQSVLTFINNYVLNNTSELDNNSILSAMQGPYHISYQLPGEPQELLDQLSLGVGMNEVQNLEVTKRDWFRIDLSRAAEEKSIPVSAHLELDSPNILSPVDHLDWEARNELGQFTKCNAYITYFDETELLTHATVEARGFPGKASLVVDYSRVNDGLNITPVEYRANSEMEYLSYSNTQFYNYPAMAPFRTMRINMHHIPRAFDLEITSDVNRELPDPLNINNSLPITVRLIDNLVNNIMSRFSRIGRTLSGISDSMTKMSETGGWMKVSTLEENSYFGDWEFMRTSGPYLQKDKHMNMDYLAFLDLSLVEGYQQGDGGGTKTSISGKLSGFSQLHLNFSEFTKIEGHFPGRDLSLPFHLLLKGGEKDFDVRFSNFPRYLYFSVLQDGVEIKLDGESRGARTIEEIEMVYRYLQRYMQIRLTGVKDHVRYHEKNGELKAIASVPLGLFEFHITNNTDVPLKELAGNFVYLHLEKESIMLSGKIASLREICYKPGSEGYFRLNYENESAFSADLYTYLNDSSQARFIIDPLPNNFTFELSGALGDPDYKLPDVGNITGNLNLSSMVNSITDVLYDIVDLTFLISSAFLENIGNISNQFNFSYKLEEDRTLDILGYFRKGDVSTLKETHWIHGLSFVQERLEGQVVMEGKIYLQGMPPTGSISTQMDGDDTVASLAFNKWRPENSWILMESYGIQNRDVVVYINGLKSNIDFRLDVNITTNMTMGGRIEGVVSLSCSSNPGQFYISFIKYGETNSATKILLSSVPKFMSISLEMFGRLALDYSAAAPIKYIYFTNSRQIDGKWYHAHGIFHNVVEHIVLKLEPRRELDLTIPIPIQTLPEFSLYSHSSSDLAHGSLDLHMQIEGRAVGQMGNMLLDVRDISDMYLTILDNGVYRLNSSGNGVGYISMEVSEMPLMKAFSLDNLHISGENVKNMEILLNMIFGVYPVFEIRGLEAKDLFLNIRGTISLMNLDFDINAVLIDINLDGSDLGITAIMNGMAMESDSRKHLIIPQPLLTLWASVLG